MNFDRLAPFYDRLEALTAGPRLQRARTTWLDALAGRKRILSLGEGHGRFAAACAARWPDAELTCIDASAGMLAAARARCGGQASRLRWIEADATTWTPDGPYDAVITCFFLDCFPPDTVAALVHRYAAATAPGALWLVADFAVPARGPARWRAQAVHALMYGFFRLVTRLPAHRLTPPDDALRAAGFALADRRESAWGLLRADLWRRD